MRGLLCVLLLTSLAWAQGWPPQTGLPYPNLKLVNQDGKLTELASFRGKVVLVEPVGMSCPACNAFAGGQARGGFGGLTPQAGLPSYRELVSRYARVTLPNPDLVLVQILFYNQTMGVPKLADVRAWAKHFGLATAAGEYVLLGTKALQTQATYAMIPGFHLVDREGLLRVDSSGHNPPSDLYRQLLPSLGRMLTGL